MSFLFVSRGLIVRKRSAPYELSFPLTGTGAREGMIIRLRVSGRLTATVISQLNALRLNLRPMGVVMAGIFYTDQLAKKDTGSGNWDTVEAYFPELQVFATISLSMFLARPPESGRTAKAYIGTFASASDDNAPNTVYKRTGHLTFTLAVLNAQASAVFSIYHYEQAAISEMAQPEHRLDLAIHDEAGNVVGTHRVVQLPGGAKIYEDAVREQVLTEARARIEDRALDVTAIDLEAIPDRQSFRIDPSTRKPLPLA
jgi:hypothetical protein